MAKRTMQELVIATMKHEGFREVIPSPSRKYRLLTGQAGTAYSGRKYWVGRMGAVRVGNTISDSISVTDSWQRQARRFEQNGVI